MPIISQLVRHPAFLSEVVEGIRQQLLGALIHDHGIEGTVVDYRLTTPLEFSPAECVGATCTIAFSGMGELTGMGPGVETNSPLTFLTQRPLSGYVDVAWTEDFEADTPEKFEALYAAMTFDIRVEQAGISGE